MAAALAAALGAVIVEAAAAATATAVEIVVTTAAVAAAVTAELVQTEAQAAELLVEVVVVVKTLIRNKKKAIFHCKTEGYNPNQNALHQLARHQQTIIFRLRTGHCRLNSHLKRIGVKCPCGEADQTPEHYLQSCSLHQQARQQIWPMCVSLKTKLWGSAEGLFLTSRYAALTGERI